ncbi:MAG TPA: FAD-binding oxidoreductase [Candidatus Dormibacteraeota bacterium]|nr:FAD-binding oxidoreductase [Candidatus Dormibacteraeota bacterium]
MVTAERAADAFAGVVGAGFVRDAGAGDAVGGVMPAVVVSPGSEAEVAEVLRAAARLGLAVAVRGGGTKLGWGAPPRRCEVVLSTARLDAMVEHEPGDLVCVVQAGMPLSALRETLAAQGQRLALDPPHGVAATVGGIVAADASGPLRTRFGTARDLVLGARFVLADGTVGHSGGKVVKNVAGYDVGKLLIGSLGTLAVVTQLALRLHPMPRAVRTVAFQNLDASQAWAVWQAVERAPVEPAAVVALSPGGAMLVRIEGGEAGAEAQASALLEATAPLAPLVRVLDEDEADKAWTYAETCVWGGDPVDPVANLALPRSELAALLGRLEATPHVAAVLPSCGAAEVRLPAGMSPVDLQALRDWVARRGGHLTLRRSTPPLADLVWPQPAAGDVALDLMRSLKQALDPGGLLAPGRFLGGI